MVTKNELSQILFNPEYQTIQEKNNIT